MYSLNVALCMGKSEIIICRDSINSVGEIIYNRFGKRNIFIITDSKVEALYGESVKARILLFHHRVEVVSFKEGEQSKTFETSGALIAQLLQLNIKRGDCVVALGGGVVGDMAGFVASILFRGVDFIQIPTTLLAQVDSSVGGKVGVDTPAGKNFIGSFYQPKLVVIDPNFLNSLDNVHIQNGMAEVIKYGIIFDKLFFEYLANIEYNELSQHFENIIIKCVEFKACVVEKDEFDTGERMLLNFGHTLGHALEKYYDYEGLLHGQAVSIGMVWAARKSVDLGYLSLNSVEQIVALLKKFSLPTELPVEFTKLQPLMIQDKKNLNSRVTLILLSQIGEAKRVELDTL